MVHSKLIQEGKVVSLTFSQLRKLEKMDAKKEREAKLFEIAKNVPIAAGYVIGQLFDALGRVGEGYMSGDALAFTAKSAAAAVALNWVNETYPGFAHATHLDTFPGVITFGGPIPTPTPPGSAAAGSFCVRTGSFQDVCFSTDAERQRWVEIGLRLGRVREPLTYYVK